MVKNYLVPFVALAFILVSATGARAQENCFRKGTILLSISGGSTTANYETVNKEAGEQPRKEQQKIDGIRDPFIFEYGITDRIGIGFSEGYDIFNVDAAKFYGTKTNQIVTATTSEFTFDASYHLYTDHRADLTTFGSIGFYKMNINEVEPRLAEEGGDIRYKYFGNGAIVRSGILFRFYVSRRIALLGMSSVYASYASSKQVKTNNIGKGYSTRLTGIAFEWGLSYKLKM